MSFSDLVTFVLEPALSTDAHLSVAFLCCSLCCRVRAGRRWRQRPWSCKSTSDSRFVVAVFRFLAASCLLLGVACSCVSHCPPSSVAARCATPRIHSSLSIRGRAAHAALAWCWLLRSQRSVAPLSLAEMHLAQPSPLRRRLLILLWSLCRLSDHVNLTVSLRCSLSMPCRCHGSPVAQFSLLLLSFARPLSHVVCQHHSMFQPFCCCSFSFLSPRGVCCRCRSSCVH